MNQFKIHLQRFEHSTGYHKKISKYVSFPEELDMTPFMSSSRNHNNGYSQQVVQEAATSLSSENKYGIHKSDLKWLKVFRKLRVGNRVGFSLMAHSHRVLVLAVPLTLNSGGWHTALTLPIHCTQWWYSKIGTKPIQDLRPVRRAVTG